MQFLRTKRSNDLLSHSLSLSAPFASAPQIRGPLALAAAIRQIGRNVVSITFRSCCQSSMHLPNAEIVTPDFDPYTPPFCCLLYMDFIPVIFFSRAYAALFFYWLTRKFSDACSRCSLLIATACFIIQVFCYFIRCGSGKYSIFLICASQSYALSINV